MSTGLPSVCVPAQLVWAPHLQGSRCPTGSWLGRDPAVPYQLPAPSGELAERNIKASITDVWEMATVYSLSTENENFPSCYRNIGKEQPLSLLGANFV